MVKRDLFVRAGGYKETYSKDKSETSSSEVFGMIEDSDLCMRVRELRKGIVSLHLK